MWGVVDDSAEEPWHELWDYSDLMAMYLGSTRRCARKPIRRRSSRKRGARPVMPTCVRKMRSA